MRGDVLLTARLLLRGTGLAGLTAVAGGGLAVVAATRPWYVAVARVEMLGADQVREVEALPGLPTVPWAWLAFVAGLAALGIGLSVAVDRPYRRSRAGLVVAAALLAVAAAGALAAPVGLAQVAGDETRELLAVAGDLPAGVDLTVATGLAVGAWLTLMAAALVALGAAAARDV